MLSMGEGKLEKVVRRYMMLEWSELSTHLSDIVTLFTGKKEMEKHNMSPFN